MSPAATPGGVQYSGRRQEAMDAGEQRRRTEQRATDAQRHGEEPLDAVPSSEMGRWWTEENQNWSERMFASPFDKNKKKLDGMFVPELKELQSPTQPLELSYAEDNFFVNPDIHMADEVFDEARCRVLPPSFDPAIDEIDDDDFVDGQVMLDVQKAVEEDRRRLEAFGNPLLVEDQVDYLLEPQREGMENMQQQQQEFNGFVH
ncbi:hypothetical protein TraAM80_01799 [Trypanosoma rangeli]|uniref:Uncharacterized protein n=1 Tax=Trypanosoma rangeli TaxID=5698 RepID=A0A422NWV6_TRYRA|nr:uncharacterized protein TraAM80_01799 [Trypanosoma rangeli]RNF09960.1 hypothetical protein TraAM80_01799 [Trypanosoma rangeli]|eukprot:RNF09960.1 hypothetical protein TraAM80_01799 [Trypanosoma rangeli]